MSPSFLKHVRFLFTAAILTLAGASTLLAEGTPMTATISGGDSWVYEGEVIVAGGQTCTFIPCNFYCQKGTCAHGKGRLGTDGSWWYDGSFVGGQMEGAGRYENDFYEYVGGFEANMFHGKGKLSCYSGLVYEGEFDRGNLVGKPPVETGGFAGAPMGWVELCKR